MARSRHYSDQVNKYHDKRHFPEPCTVCIYTEVLWQDVNQVIAKLVQRRYKSDRSIVNHIAVCLYFIHVY